MVGGSRLFLRFGGLVGGAGCGWVGEEQRGMFFTAQEGEVVAGLERGLCRLLQRAQCPASARLFFFLHTISTEELHGIASHPQASMV